MYSRYFKVGVFGRVGIRLMSLSVVEVVAILVSVKNIGMFFGFYRLRRRREVLNFG